MERELTDHLTTPPLQLPIRGGKFTRTEPYLLDTLGKFGTGTVVSILHELGIRQPAIQGPVALRNGTSVAGNALTLQFMPQREDFTHSVDGRETEVERDTALWSVLRSAVERDVLVIQAYGDQRTGCIGEMLTTHFVAQGGIGLVIDGYMRDWSRVRELDVPVWACGTTPNFATQSLLQPWAYNVPVACGGVLVLPGDVILADDDGAVVIPRQLAELVAAHAVDHEEQEAFSRLRLADGGELRRYYPLDDRGQREFDAWRETRRRAPTTAE